MKFKNLRIWDCCTIEKKSTVPQLGIYYNCFSFPAFDNHKTPEYIDGRNIKSNKLILNENTILFNKLNPKFKRVWNIHSLKDYDNAICSTEFLPLKCNDNVDQDFLYFYISSLQFTQLMDGIKTGTSNSQQRIDWKLFLNQMIALPTFKQQKKIAQILSEIDNKIELNSAINNNLYQILLASFKHDYFENSSTSWEEVTLDDVTSKVATGLNPRKNFVLGHGDNFYVTIKNMGNNRIYLDDKCDKVDDDALVKINKRSDLAVGDCLFSGIGTIGRVHFVSEPANNWNISESVFTLRAASNISPEFLYLLLLYSDMQDYANSLASGSAQKGIRMADLKKYRLRLPTDEEMNNFTSLWRPIIQQVKNNEQESDNLAILRNSLLPKLMSGELDVSDIDL